MKPFAMAAAFAAFLAPLEPAAAGPNGSPVQPSAKTLALLAAFISAVGRNAPANVVAPLRRPAAPEGASPADLRFSAEKRAAAELASPRIRAR